MPVAVRLETQTSELLETGAGADGATGPVGVTGLRLGTAAGAGAEAIALGTVDGGPRHEVTPDPPGAALFAKSSKIILARN